MHYIRFLRTPKVEVTGSTIQLTSKICITTDLGETFYPLPLDLIATLRSPSPSGEIYLRRKYAYPASARSLEIKVDLGGQDIEWPACLHVYARTGGDEEGRVGFLPGIVDVWSGCVDPTKGGFESGLRVERRFVSLAERMVSLLEDAGDSIARHLWDGSQALAQHIDAVINMQAMVTVPLLEYVLVSATYRRMNVLELGCGCGSVGISLAQSIPDCSVILTDLEEARELVDENIKRMKPAISSRVRFEALDWEQNLPDVLQNRTNDLIIVSECTYNSDTLEPLVQTLVNLLARSPKAVIVVATKTRHESEAAFFQIMRDAGIIEDGSMRLPLPGIPGNGYADWAEDVGLHLFHGREQRLSLTPRTGSDESVPKAVTTPRSKSR